jgi:regulator of cell morphogenesis and NO signaling
MSGMKMSDIIIGNPYIMLMLEYIEINMELHEKTVEQICNEYKINLELFLAIANLYNGIKPTPIKNYSNENIKTIIKYLKNSHLYYIKEKFPQIKIYIEKIHEINKHIEILMVEKFFNKYIKEVIEHLNYENDVVFPYILNLDNKSILMPQSKDCRIDLQGYSVKEYREHHDDIEEKLSDLKNLLIKYLPQENDQQIRRELLFRLFELEYDLNIHTQIEETILIPMVEKLEQKAGK